MSSVSDLVIEDLTIEIQNLREEVIRLLAQAATYRQMMQVTLAELAEATRETAELRHRLRQTMGIESWTGDTVDSES